MERKKASDYPQELLDLFHEYQHGDIDRRAFLDRAEKFAVGGADRDGDLSRACARITPGPKQVTKDDARIKTELRNGAVAAGQRHDQGLLRAAGEADRQAAGGARHPREPRPQSVRRGRRAPLCRRELHRLRARWSDLGRRLSRATTKRARSSSARSTVPR